jgi:hypothetical protein
MVFKTTHFCGSSVWVVKDSTLFKTHLHNVQSHDTKYSEFNMFKVIKRCYKSCKPEDEIPALLRITNFLIQSL